MAPLACVTLRDWFKDLVVEIPKRENLELKGVASTEELLRRQTRISLNLKKDDRARRSFCSHTCRKVFLRILAWGSLETGKPCDKELSVR